MEKVPIRVIDFSDRADVAIHKRIVDLVNLMLDLLQQLPKAKTPHEKESIQRQIDTTNKEIDQFVYKLYALDNDEIKIVEKIH
jgi:hypothetical protein